MKNYEQLQKLNRALHFFKRHNVFKKQKYELSDSELNVLFCIYFCDEFKKIKLTDIANKLSVTLPAITQKANDLEKKGMMIKEASKKDQRVIYVRLTTKAKHMLAEVVETYYQPIEDMMKSIGEDDANQLISILDKINHSNKKGDL